MGQRRPRRGARAPRAAVRCAGAGNIACVNTSAAGLESETTETGNTGHRLIIAVDGPSGSGKSSASRGAATALGLEYLDTGATYRALTWWMLTHGIDAADPEAVAANAGTPGIEVGTDPADPYTRVDGTDVSKQIRTHEVTAAVSAVASVPEVRRHLIALQRAVIARASRGIVAEGRDIGTVVAPDASVKVFLTADSGARATRRAEQANWQASATRAEQDQRDRKDAPQSGKADDAVIIDSTDLDLDEVIDRIVAMARRVPGPRPWS
jgi:CMP/dCMP kinase